MPISVITPAFNSQATLERAYQSLRGQSFRDWEYIIVDDGSRDETAGVAKSFADSDSRVTLVRTENRGTGAALNRGIQEAKGTWIAFLDADDEYLPAHLERRLEAAEADPDVDIFWGAVELIVHHPSDAFVPDMEKGSGLIHASECIVQGTLFVRRMVFDQFLFSEDRSVWYQDLDFMRRASGSHKIVRLSEATYRYYRNSGTSQVDRAKADWACSQ